MDALFPELYSEFIKALYTLLGVGLVAIVILALSSPDKPSL